MNTKGILVFKLPQEAEGFRTADDGWKWKALAQELDGYLQGKLKNGDTNQTRQLIYQRLRDELHILLNQRDLVLD